MASTSDDTVDMTDAPVQDASAAEPMYEIPISFAGQTHVFRLPADAVLDDLTIACKDLWDKDAAGASQGYDWSAHKFIAPPPIGLIKALDDFDRPLARLLQLGAPGSGSAGKRRRPVALRLVASRAKDVQAIRAMESTMRRLQERRLAYRPRVHPAGSAAKPASPYRFEQVSVLTYKSHAERSLAFLQRLRNDVGVVAAMQAHRFTVGLLTEMDPAHHTTASHEGVSRTLGLNRNRGEVIELRLRTDAGDGFRDYRTVRRTLCHELAHNVHGPHDANFWALCRQLEREVEQADYHRSGRTLDGGSQNLADYYADSAEDDHTDNGGWTGGTFVLGSGAVPGEDRSATLPVPVKSLAERRAAALRAAEARMQHGQDGQSGGGKGGKSRDSNNSSTGSAP